MDLADPAQWQRVAAVFESALRDFAGDRVVFVHAAGTLTPIRFAGEGDAADYQRNVLLNSAAPQVLGDAFLRALRATQAPADLLFIGSGASKSVYEGWSGYCAGKAAVDHWTRTVGAEQARRGARRRILCVAPGVVATPMQAEIRETPPRDFPDVARFLALHDDGALREPSRSHASCGPSSIATCPTAPSSTSAAPDIAPRGGLRSAPQTRFASRVRDEAREDGAWIGDPVAAQDFGEDVAEIGGHGEVAVLEEILGRETGPVAALREHATAAYAAAQREHHAPVAVVGSAAAVLCGGPTELGHHQRERPRRVAAEILLECGERAGERARDRRHLGVVVDVMIEAVQVDGERPHADRDLISAAASRSERANSVSGYATEVARETERDDRRGASISSRSGSCAVRPRIEDLGRADAFGVESGIRRVEVSSETNEIGRRSVKRAPCRNRSTRRRTRRRRSGLRDSG